jgi:hypothetical protein
MAETANRQLGKPQAAHEASPSATEMKAAIREARVRLATRLAQTADHAHMVFTAPTPRSQKRATKASLGPPSTRLLWSAEPSVPGTTRGIPVSFDEQRSALRQSPLRPHLLLRQDVADTRGALDNGEDCGLRSFGIWRQGQGSQDEGEGGIIRRDKKDRQHDGSNSFTIR